MFHFKLHSAQGLRRSSFLFKLSKPHRQTPARRSFPGRSGSLAFPGRSGSLEKLEDRTLLDGAIPALAHDYIEVYQNDAASQVAVLANDFIPAEYEGAGRISSVSFGSRGGTATIVDEGAAIAYAPPADFRGVEEVTYFVDGAYSARLFVTVSAPLEDDQWLVYPGSGEQQFDVLANDPFWDGYAGAREITSVSVSRAGGDVEIAPDGQAILYTPPTGNFTNDDFVYIVDGRYPARVRINIPDPLDDDSFDLFQNSSSQLDPLANDPFWPGYAGERRITHVIGGHGEIAIADDGKSLTYVATADAVGYDSFRYVVDGAYEESVSVFRIRPVMDDRQEVDRNSSDAFFDVLSNDRYRDRYGNWRDVVSSVTSVSPSVEGGIVSVAPGGNGVLYTPPADFFGKDTFTYIADGRYEASVEVDVTRPVRDDNIYQVVVQDTPSARLDVLANDFLGNGYVGERLITEVTPTENGGIVTISSDGKSINYSPAEGFIGTDRFTYTVDDDLSADVIVSVQPLANSDYDRFEANPNVSYHIIDVFANDRFHLGYPGPAVVTEVEMVNGDGAVSIAANGEIRFTPGLANWHEFRYTVDGKYTSTAGVGIVGHLNFDQFVVDQNDPGHSLDVLANDFTRNYGSFRSRNYQGPRHITDVVASENGSTVTIGSEGQVIYTPPEDFVGTDRFTYVVDGVMRGVAEVEVIRRVRDDQFRVDQEDGTRLLPVLVNDLFGADYTGPRTITSVTPAESGAEVTIAADGKSVSYTPADGFSGTDTFSYIVDSQLIAHVSVTVDTPADDRYATFADNQEYTDFLIEDAVQRYAHLFGSTSWWDSPWAFDAAEGPTSRSGNAEPTRGHSETNVQVDGIDEADIVEFDADYAYVLTNNQLIIVDAWPAESLEVASTLPIPGRAVGEFLNGDRLTVISTVTTYEEQERTVGTVPLGGVTIDVVSRDAFFPTGRVTYETLVTVIDVSDRTAPEVVQTTKMEGSYVDSRAVDGEVFVVLRNEAVAPAPKIIYPEDENPDDGSIVIAPGTYETEEEYLARITANPGELIEAALPNYTTLGSDGNVVRTGLLHDPETIYQPIVTDASNLLSVVSFNSLLEAPGIDATSGVYSSGAGEIYASYDGFYLLDTEYRSNHAPNEDGAVTRITKFDWEPAAGTIDFATTTTIPGTFLDQFSADEYGGYFRIATTVSNSYAGNWSGAPENMLFVLHDHDGVFENVGVLQNLALGERMQSVRFMGDRAVLTTFRNVDPLFGIDLSDPSNPHSLGHLTLPGFSTYMQFLDDDHLLTVGRNTPGGTFGPTQVALFDVSDLTAPTMLDQYTFAHLSNSEAETDHHAFGYFAAHDVLAIPASRNFYIRVDNDNDGYHESSQFQQEFDLAIFDVDLTNGGSIDLEARISHEDPVRRSGYIGDKLYSVSHQAVHVVDVADPSTIIASVTLPQLPEEPVDQIVLPFVIDDESLDNALATARNHLARLTETQAGAASLNTVERAGDGYQAIFEVGDQLFRYRTTAAGAASLMDDDFAFTDQLNGVWHTILDEEDIVAGDFNFDGDVNFGDLHWFALALTDPQQFANERGYSADIFGDINQDGNFDFGDLSRFAALLTEMQTNSIPSEAETGANLVDSSEADDQATLSLSLQDRDAFFAAFD